ncbi:MAG TPA: hypothetical protein VII45_12975 [Solirubrobacterales bacterium]
MTYSLRDRARLLGRGHASARFWAAAVSCQLERIESHLRCLHETEARSGVPSVPVYDVSRPIHAYDALEIDVHFLLVAVRNVLWLLKRHEDQLGKDDRLRAAGAVFEAKFEHVRKLRNVLEHFDGYAVGRGDFQDEVEPDARRALPYFVQASNDGNVASLEFRLGKLSVPVKEVADDAIRLADVIEEVRQDFV